MKDFKLEDFPLIAFDKIRYADTDRQGHVNNANFSTFIETGRVEFLHHKEFPISDEGFTFVIASLDLKFLAEVFWPGRVDIGTGILKIGRSSIKIFQKIFQNGKCVASAETTIVQVSNKGSEPLSDAAKSILDRWLLTDLE